MPETPHTSNPPHYWPPQERHRTISNGTSTLGKISTWAISAIIGVASAYATIQIRMGSIEQSAVDALRTANENRAELKEVRESTMPKAEMIYRFDVLTKSIDDLHKDFIDRQQRGR